MLQANLEALCYMKLSDTLANEPWMSLFRDPIVLAQTKPLYWQIHNNYTNSVDSTKDSTCSGKLHKEHKTCKTLPCCKFLHGMPEWEIKSQLIFTKYTERLGKYCTNILLKIFSSFTYWLEIVFQIIMA